MRCGVTSGIVPPEWEDELQIGTHENGRPGDSEGCEKGVGGEFRWPCISFLFVIDE